MTKVLYLSGWGRSGTTVVGRLLASLPGFVGVGELRLLPDRALEPGHRCECGEVLEACELWGGIVPGLRETHDLARLATIDDRLLATRSFPMVARQVRNRSLRGERHEFAELMGTLYDQIAERTGARVIVDTSKSPTVALLLGSLRRHEPYIVHLVRDPRAVAHSWNRRKADPARLDGTPMRRYGAFGSSRRWLTWNLLNEVGPHLIGSGYARLRYESFASAPRDALADVLAAVGEADSAARLPFLDSSEFEITPSHMVDGNPNRHERGRTRIKLDDEWRTVQAPRDRLVSAAVAAPLLHRYRYGVS